jgi:hypothetical protein
MRCSIHNITHPKAGRRLGPGPGEANRATAGRGLEHRFAQMRLQPNEPPEPEPGVFS